jgi:hypothetical protein
MCQRLAELGMALAEATQREALRDLQPRPERHPPAPGTYRPPSPPTFHDTTLCDTFATIARCVRQAILLEARLDNGSFDHPPPARSTPAPALAQHQAASHARRSDDTTRLRAEPLEDDLAADAKRAAPEILAGICQALAETVGSAQPTRRPTPPTTSRHPPPAAKPKKPTHPPDRPPPLRSG